MKRLNLLLLLFTAIFLNGVAASAFGQDIPPPDGQTAARPEGSQRPNLLAELGLTQDQVRQIRKINQERKPEMTAAQRRMREANRKLDMAIYSDAVNEDDVQVRLKEFAAAQAEVIRLRFTSELAVRKVLTNEQLIRFRELRQKFAEARENMQKLWQPPPNGEKPLRPIDRLRRRPPGN